MMTVDEIFDSVTEVLADFVRTFDEEYTVALSGDFMADNIEECIYYAPMSPAESGEAFRQNFIKRFPVCKAFSLFMLSFMHELGHLETEWDMVDDTDERNATKDNETYFALHNEKIATDWAGEYLTDHFSEMVEFDRELLEILGDIWASIPD
jgi:hypothetical protein